MWIITRLSGVISADAVTRFTENYSGTYAYQGNLCYQVSEAPVLETIIQALKNNQDFLEVE
jgi:hypothetical protein